MDQLAVTSIGILAGAEPAVSNQVTPSATMSSLIV
jgi:hypothetical protein